MEHVRLLANPVVSGVVDMLTLANPTPQHADFIMRLIELGSFQLSAACSWWEIWLTRLYAERKKLQDARNRWVEFYREKELEELAEMEAEEDEEEDEEEYDEDEEYDDDDEYDEDDIELDDEDDDIESIGNVDVGYFDSDGEMIEEYGGGYSSIDIIESPFDADEELPLTLDDTETQLLYVEKRIRWFREQIKRADETGDNWSATRLIEFFEQPEGERQGKSFEPYLPKLLRRAYHEITLAMAGVGFAHREAVGAQQVLDRWQPSNNVNGPPQPKRRLPPLTRGGGGEI